MPTPASVAELSSQQALPDMSSTESNFQVKKEEEDNTVGKKQVDIKMEVWYLQVLVKHVMSLCLCVLCSAIYNQDSWLTVFLLM